MFSPPPYATAHRSPVCRPGPHTAPPRRSQDAAAAAVAGFRGKTEARAPPPREPAKRVPPQSWAPLSSGPAPRPSLFAGGVLGVVRGVLVQLRFNDVRGVAPG